MSLILPFGKYATKSIQQLFLEKPEYCKWLVSQPWLQKDQPEIYEFLEVKFKNQPDLITRGKYKGKNLSDVEKFDEKYYNWYVKNVLIDEKKLLTE